MIGFSMSSAAVGFALDESWALPAKSPLPGLVNSREDGHRIIAVDHLARHRIGGGPVGNVLYPGVFLVALGSSVHVVFTDKNNRKSPQAREIQGLVKRSLIGGTIPKKTDGCAALLFVPLSKGNSHGYGEASPYHGSRTERIHLRNGHVQSAALAFVTARPLAVDFRHEGSGISSFGKQMAVTAVIGDDHIFRTQSGTRAGSYRLLARTQDHHSGDLSLNRTELRK